DTRRTGELSESGADALSRPGTAVPGKHSRRSDCGLTRAAGAEGHGSVSHGGAVAVSSYGCRIAAALAGDSKSHRTGLPLPGSRAGNARFDELRFQTQMGSRVATMLLAALPPQWIA